MKNDRYEQSHSRSQAPQKDEPWGNFLLTCERALTLANLLFFLSSTCPQGSVHPERS
jgi:hypothetical protein